MTTGKSIAFTIQTFVSKMTSLLFNMLSRFVIAFLPKSKCLLILWLQSLFAVILESKKLKTVTIFPLFLLLLAMKWKDWIPWSLFFECWNFKPAFSLSSFTLIKRIFSSSLYKHSHSLLDILPTEVTTEHWVEFPVLHSRFLISYFYT